MTDYGLPGEKKGGGFAWLRNFDVFPKTLDDAKEVRPSFSVSPDPASLNRQTCSRSMASAVTCLPAAPSSKWASQTAKCCLDAL